MPTILSRIFLLYNLLNAIILYFVPKKFRNYISPSRHSYSQQKSETVQSSSPTRAISKMDPNELKRVYEMFDKNGDGRITKQELNDSLKNMGIFVPDEDLTDMIEKIDSNRDGCVDLDEFGALYETMMGDHDGEEDMREAFGVFDQNGDGFITVEELRSVLASIGLKQGKAAEDCKEMILKVDVDGDGMVNFNEFKRMMRGGGFAALTN